MLSQVRVEVGKIVTRLKRFHCLMDRPRAERDEITNPFSLPNQWNNDLEKEVANYFANKLVFPHVSLLLSLSTALSLSSALITIPR